ncbi:MAG TPA: SAM-dependent methyltransferase [Anaerolineaceae bacterium]|nr:SAM-dependent methyltransferase [Anaerolineaceae bacterium]
MKPINPERFQRLVTEAWTADFSGWDFQWLEGRLVEEPLPWDYARIVSGHFPGVHTLLDIGTGGGELLASLAPLPPETHATETYPPNQIIAKARLEPLGVQVHTLQESASLPFPDHFFDLVINRHDDYHPTETFRILRPGGVFITQQVGGLDTLELNQVLEEDLSFPYTSWCLAEALNNLYEAGFVVLRSDQATLRYTFLDIGAVVYYLKAIPWQVDDFSPETHHKGLMLIHNIIESRGQFVCTAHRFLIVAQKESSSP